MTSVVQASRPTVQVYSPTLAEEALIVTFFSYPSGSTLIRTVPQTSFEAGNGGPLCESLSAAVEEILGEGIATSAAGTNGVDDSGLIYDAVIFTVEYEPSPPRVGRILADVTIPVQTITIDTQFGSIPGFQTAPELILDTYNKLKAMAGG